MYYRFEKEITMKKLLLPLLGLLLAMTADAAMGDASVLKADSISLHGSRLAQLTQHIEACVCNTSGADYEGRLYLQVLDMGSGSLISSLDTLVTVEANGSKSLVFYCALPEGNLKLRLAAAADGRQVLATRDVIIQPLRKLDFLATFSLDMLTESDGERVLYGSRIRGWVCVENYDTPYYGVNGGTGNDDGVVLWLESEDERLFTMHIASKLDYWGKAEANFSYDAVFRDGARYILKIGYGMPDGLEAIDSLCFATRSGTNTYWTASGQVLPLPLGAHQQLTIPEEAVAVDLRGQHTFNTMFSIDVSHSNPNCLYYLDLLDNVPQGLGEERNVVRGLEAENIKLTEGHDYFCPLAFRTQFISYLITPSYNNPDDEVCGRGYSETLVLPFHPSHVNLYDINGNGMSRLRTDVGDSVDNGGGKVSHEEMLTVLRYYGNVGDSLTVAQLNSVLQMEAYVPYILGIYIGSSLLFIGENTEVPMTSEAIVRGGGIDFIGTTVGLHLLPNFFAFDPDSNRFCQGETDEWVPPFHAYMAAFDGASHQQLNISNEAWGSKGNPNDATAIHNIDYFRMMNDDTVSCYDLSGRRLSDSHLQSLPKGIYIVGGRKVVVK